MSKGIPQKNMEQIVPVTKIALLIGIEDYSNSKEFNFGSKEPRTLKKPDNLKHPMADVKAMRELLGNFGFEIITNEPQEGHEP